MTDKLEIMCMKKIKRMPQLRATLEEYKNDNNKSNKNKFTLTSMEVAEMIGKKHYDLLKDIRKYATYLNEGNFPLVEFFVESTYGDTKGEERKCYQITEKGCEMIAHKLTGQKGVIFTALYS